MYYVLTLLLLVWWIMGDQQNAVQAILGTMALAFAYPVIEHFEEWSWPRIFKRLIPAAVFGVVAWQWPLGFLGAPLAESAGRLASNAWTWFALIAAFWAYTSASSLLSQWRAVVALKQRDAAATAIRESVVPVQHRLAAVIEDSLIPFKVALERLVMPRVLTPEQMKDVAEYLSGHTRFPVEFVVLKNCNEAGSYRTYIQRALHDGGWAQTSVTHATDIQEGMHVCYDYAEEAAGEKDDPASPRPDEVLKEAFRRAGVVFNSRSGGGPRTRLVIEIGARRRDPGATPQPFPTPKHPDQG